MLCEGPELEAKALFEWMCEQKPGWYRTGQLRIFQRWVERWRVLNQSQVASLAQVRLPGEMIQLDGTWLTELGVMIQGEPFKRLLIHCVLPYSNWEWGWIVVAVEADDPLQEVVSGCGHVGSGELKAEKLTAGSRHRIREDALREYAQRQRVTLSLDAIDTE